MYIALVEKSLFSGTRKPSLINYLFKLQCMLIVKLHLLFSTFAHIVCLIDSQFNSRDMRNENRLSTYIWPVLYTVAWQCLLTQVFSLCQLATLFGQGLWIELPAQTGTEACTYYYTLHIRYIVQADYKQFTVSCIN